MDKVLELGQTFFYMNYADQILEARVTKIVLEEGKKPIYYFNNEAFYASDVSLDVEELCTHMINYYEEKNKEIIKGIKDQLEKFQKQDTI